MVYCGKPSRACHACRERKTRCDSKPDGCSQCVKAKRPCPGYRRQVDLIFRDQSDNVIRKAKAREKKKADAANAGNTTPASSDLGSGDSGYDSDKHVLPALAPLTHDQQVMILEQTPDFLHRLMPAVEDRATCYFVKNYAIGITVPGYGEFNSLTAAHVTTIMNPVLAASMKATSFASYAAHVRSQEMTDRAQMEYMNAITLTNAALSSPSEVTKDSTLLSVILLGQYEMLTGKTQRSMKDWAQHVRGAAALLNLRGAQQFSNILGRRMFVQAASSLLVSCMQRGRRVPTHVMEMMNVLKDSAKISAFPWYMTQAVRSFQAMLDYNEFRCSYKDGMYPDPAEQISKLLEIDAPFAESMSHPPPLWDYEEYYRDQYDPSIIFQGRYHVYRDNWSIPLCNNIRNFRLMINDDIRGVLLDGFNMNPPIFTDPKDYAQFQRSTELCYQLIADILASVPHALGFIEKKGPKNAAFPTQPWHKPDSSNLSNPVLGLSVSADQPAAKNTVFNWSDLIQDEGPATHSICNEPGPPTYNAFSLFWPLWYSGFCRLAKEDVKQYAVANLRRIGNEMGVKQALMMADTIVTNTEPKAWSDGS